MPPVWVIDSSSLIEIKFGVPLVLRARVLGHLDKMAADGLLKYPSQVLGELKRYAPSKKLKTDLPYAWAQRNESQACHPDLLLEEAKAILNDHKDLIEPDKPGPDPADPYVIALALKLKGKGQDARIVTDDIRNINRKVSVAAVAGLLGVPSTVMRLFLRGEGFNY